MKIAEEEKQECTKQIIECKFTHKEEEQADILTKCRNTINRIDIFIKPALKIVAVSNGWKV